MSIMKGMSQGLKNEIAMKREEFAKKWGHERTMNTMGLPVTIPKYDEFLADLDSLFPPAEGARKVQWSGYGELGNISQKPLQPTAEDAEEIPDTKKFLSDNGYGSGTNYTTNQVAYLIREFATLHAQKIADKMVKDMRQKLFSMRSSKEAMDKLSEADRLMMYGYHDCINEMLMWTKPREI